MVMLLSIRSISMIPSGISFINDLYSDANLISIVLLILLCSVILLLLSLPLLVLDDMLFIILNNKLQLYYLSLIEIIINDTSIFNLQDLTTIVQYMYNLITNNECIPKTLMKHETTRNIFHCSSLISLILVNDH